MTTDPTLAAVERVDRNVRDMRVELSGRMDAMVTRREHQAEVRRIDADAQAAREALARHEAEEGIKLRDIEKSIRAGDEKILAVIANQESARAATEKARDDERKSDRRWQVGAVMTAASLAVALSQFLIRFF